MYEWMEKEKIGSERDFAAGSGLRGQQEDCRRTAGGQARCDPAVAIAFDYYWSEKWHVPPSICSCCYFALLCNRYNLPSTKLKEYITMAAHEKTILRGEHIN